jgi:tetratricopeptide (TPR) repeat protein
MKSSLIVGLLATAVLVAGGSWLYLSPDSPLAANFRSKVVEPDGVRVVSGPYPLEGDFRILKDGGVTSIVSLLDPKLPYEKELLDKERRNATKFGMQFQHVALRSDYGERTGKGADQNAAVAADTVVKAKGKVYVHDYLGIHRVDAVTELVNARGIKTERFSLYEGARSEAETALELAQTDFNKGQFQSALNRLGRVPSSDPASEVLRGWCYYRLSKLNEARGHFARAREIEPGYLDAHTGLAYCALRANDLKTAEREFKTVVRTTRDDTNALYGLALVRYRQGKPRDARESAKAVIARDPNHAEAKELLERL